MNADACASACGALLPVSMESMSVLEEESSTTDSAFALLMAALPQPGAQREVALVTDGKSGTAHAIRELSELTASIIHPAQVLEQVQESVHPVLAPTLSRVFTPQPPDLELQPVPIAVDPIIEETVSDLTPSENLQPTIDGVDSLLILDEADPSSVNHSHAGRIVAAKDGGLGQVVASIEFETGNIPDQSLSPKVQPAVESPSLLVESERRDIVDEIGESRTVTPEMSLSETEMFLPQQWISVKPPVNDLSAAIVQSTPANVEMLPVTIAEHYRQQTNADSRLVVRLDPPDLGAVIVRLSRKVAGTKVEIFAERDALNVIRDQVAAIRDALQLQTELGELEVTVSTSGGFLGHNDQSPTHAEYDAPPSAAVAKTGNTLVERSFPATRLHRTTDSAALSFLV